MQETKRDWETFVRSPAQLEEGVPIPLVLVDLTPGPRKYSLRHAVVVIDRRQDALPGADVLWVRTPVGVKLSTPYAMRIVRELPSELPGVGYRDAFEALRVAANG
ncbi:MAG: hypothetical protein E6J64_13570 [Deltaproteobacteria bacterium]|nr:MAG: hypothetical protein E6J64_13570 [Deltaproteobacteria bacterium]